MKSGKLNNNIEEDFKMNNERYNLMNLEKGEQV